MFLYSRWTHIFQTSSSKFNINKCNLLEIYKSTFTVFSLFFTFCLFPVPTSAGAQVRPMSKTLRKNSNNMRTCVCIFFVWFIWRLCVRALDWEGRNKHSITFSRMKMHSGMAAGNPRLPKLNGDEGQCSYRLIFEWLF